MSDDRFIDPDLIDTRSQDERELDLLRDWLSEPNWVFGPGENTLDGQYSEAICLLAGIDPRLTLGDSRHGFGWRFLPGALEMLGYKEYPKGERGRWELDQNVIAHLDRLRGLRPLGLARVEVIIAHAIEAGVHIPWLEMAKSDPECAKALPRVANKIGALRPLRDDYRRSSRGKAKKRWEQDDAKRLRDGIGREAFEQIRASDFDECRFKSSGQINGNAIAKCVLKAIEEFTGEGADEIPAFETVRDDVGRWLLEVGAK